MPLGRVQTQIVAKLEEMGRLSPEQRAAIAAEPVDLSGEALDKLLQDRFEITPFQCLVAKGRALGLAPYNVVRYRLTPATFAQIPKDFCSENMVLPVGSVGDFVLVVFANPFELTVAGKIQEMTGKRVVRLLGRREDIAEKFNRGGERAVDLEDVVQRLGVEFAPSEAELRFEDVTEDSGPIIQLANRIIEDAYYAGSSDIHVEPQEKELLVRYRIDGVCQEKLRLPSKVAPALVARLKIMGNLDISERRLPQDGRIVFRHFTRKALDIDLRMSTGPFNFGEGVVLRILDKQKSMLPLRALGFTEENLAKYRAMIRQPNGMILHSGPTGSGKSMTLYSALHDVSSPEVVIRTIEDPIEYTLPGINQMQMHRQIGLTFASALRSFLRQDPDIILVGEIRDRETAQVAVEAALTGHLLISTLHTNDAPSTVARLTDMGVEPFMIASSLLGVCSQRLLRRVCGGCRVAYEPGEREKEILEKAIGWSGPIYRHRARGCPQCGGAGYKGRIGIHELMVSNEELVTAINCEADPNELKKIAVRGGMKTLHQDSLLKVRDGISSLEEAIATVSPDV